MFIFKVKEEAKHSAWMQRNKRSPGEEIYFDEAEYKRSLEEKENSKNDTIGEKMDGESSNITTEEGNESVDNDNNEFFFNKTSDKVNIEIVKYDLDIDKI